MPEFKRFPKGNTRTMVDFQALLAEMQQGDEAVICLNTGMIKLIRKLLVDRGLWRTTYAIEYGDLGYTIPTEEEFNPVKQEILTFLEDNVNCLDAFTELASAVRYLGDQIYNKPCCTAAGSNIVQGANPSGGTIYGNSAPIVVSNEGTGEPPAGFESWQEYYTNKCNLAHFVVNKLIDNVRFLGSVSLANLTALAGLLGVSLGIVAVFPPSAIPIVIAALVGLGVSVGVLVTVANWLQDNKASLICDIYNSTSASQAIGKWQDAIQQAMTDSSISDVLQPFILNIALTLANTDQINAIFDGSQRVEYPGADCTECGNSEVKFILGTTYPELPGATVTDMGLNRFVIESGGSPNWPAGAPDHYYANWYITDLDDVPASVWFNDVQITSAGAIGAHVIQTLGDVDISTGVDLQPDDLEAWLEDLRHTNGYKSGYFYSAQSWTMEFTLDKRG